MVGFNRIYFTGIFMDLAPTYRQAVRDAHIAFERSQNPCDALDYLLAVRALILSQTPPENYIQRPHSDDPKPVGGHPRLPALLDASYEHFGRRLLSVSFPLFVQQDLSNRGLPWTFTKNWRGQEQLQMVHGLNSWTLSETLRSILKLLKVEYDNSDAKIGYDRLSLTNYVEFSAKSHNDFRRGRKLIRLLVHGNEKSDRRLRRLAQHLFTQQNRATTPTGLWQSVRVALTSRDPTTQLRQTLRKALSGAFNLTPK